MAKAKENSNMSPVSTNFKYKFSIKNERGICVMICLFRTCDPTTLNLPDGVTWKSKKSKNAITFKFYCPSNTGYSTVWTR